ncbi:alpha/beta fold hydrolase [Alteromonas flava]|uniref:alpha/beta fold hydrolase n=1 Tax=Alteromonas flava TaxID=2048003 RepID=UPI000C291502|nr:alpha/beta hydrolase [Alteromonas flava]
MLSPSLVETDANANNACIKGHNISYWYQQHAHSQAPTLVFIHGFPSAAWDWHNQWLAFAKSHSLLAMDLLGFGSSDKPHPYHYSLLEQANVVDELCQELGITNAIVIAHDYGNSVAQELLARQLLPDPQPVQSSALSFNVEQVIWLNGGLFAESHRPLLMQKLLKSRLGPALAMCMSKRSLTRSFRKIFAPHTPPTRETIDTLWTLLQRNQGKKVIPSLLSYIDERATYRDRWVAAMQCQAEIDPKRLAFINGVHDPISGGHMLERFQALLPNVPTAALTVGHYPQLEDAEKVNQCIKQFISEI